MNYSCYLQDDILSNWDTEKPCRPAQGPLLSVRLTFRSLASSTPLRRKPRIPTPYLDLQSTQNSRLYPKKGA